MSSLRPEHQLRFLLGAIGLLDLSALLVVFVPLAALTTATRRLGLEPLPDVPLTQYMLRTASALYALHGATLLFLARDVAAHRAVIGFLAGAALVHGSVVQGVMWAAEMPRWWQVMEALGYFGPALATLWLLRKLPAVATSR